MNNIRYRLLKGTIDLPRRNLAVPFQSSKKHDFCFGFLAIRGFAMGSY